MKYDANQIEKLKLLKESLITDPQLLIPKGQEEAQKVFEAVSPKINNDK